jgi:hypothetical protein
MHAHQHRLGRGEIALDQRQMLRTAGVSVNTRSVHAPPWLVHGSTAVSRTRLSWRRR